MYFPMQARELFFLFYLNHDLLGSATGWLAASSGSPSVSSVRYAHATGLTSPKSSSTPPTLSKYKLKKKRRPYGQASTSPINVPQISYFQWHPFTLTSAPEEDYLSVHPVISRLRSARYSDVISRRRVRGALEVKVARTSLGERHFREPAAQPHPPTSWSTGRSILHRRMS
jgi:hypothetical protein